MIASLKHKVPKGNTPENLLIACIEGLLAAKASHIKVIDMRGDEGAIALFFIICTSETHTHAKNIYEKVEEQVSKQSFMAPVGVEGLEAKEWILIDYFDVIVHIFSKRAREFYLLEELWGDFPQWEVKDSLKREEVRQQVDRILQRQVADE